MVVKPVHFIRFSRFILILCLSVIPSLDARALMESSGSASLPTLETFIRQVKNGQADVLSGIYIPGILANRIVQQPSGNSEFVSSWENIVTQFNLASQLGSTGLVAHNDLAGKRFVLLQPGQQIKLVYGDGYTATFIVSEILQYQALDAGSTSSPFLDLADKSIHSSAGLFHEMYSRPGMLILQTCISADSHPTWGRLFVIAKPSNP